MKKKLFIILFYAFLLPFLSLVPILIWKLELPFVSSTSGPEYRVFEIFAFSVTIIVVIISAAKLRNASRNIEELIPTVCFLLLACYFVTQVVEYRPQSPDWLSYERAACAVLNGTNPYKETGYLYPPLTAIVLASLYKAIVWGSRILQIASSPNFVWQGVFYLYQCTQFFLIMGAIALCFRFAKMLGASRATSAVLVSLVFVFNTAILRTLYFHQVNLWLFDFIMVAVLFSDRAPLLSGLSIAFGSHLKLYASFLLLPFYAMKKFSVLLWSLAGTILIVVIQTECGTNTTLWRQYISSAADFPAGTMFRDNGLHSIVYNTLKFMNMIIPLESMRFPSYVRVFLLLATILVVIYFVKRFIKRKRSFEVELIKDKTWATRHYLYGNVFDAIAMALIVSPLVWEHHYILTIPIIIYVVLMRGKEKPWRIFIGSFLICAIPIFDIFPFSYHRIAGLMLLLSASPSDIPVKPTNTSKFFICL